jgi:hypothetical protein
MFIPRNTAIVPAPYDVQYIPRRSSTSYSGTCCCLTGLIACILIGAALAVALVFIIKSANEGDSTKSSKFQIDN